MGDRTGIEWTDATWNPIRGCSRVSEGCRNCYAETMAKRYSGIVLSGPDAGKRLPYHGLATAKGWTGEVRLVEEHLADPLRWKRPRRVFVNSMSDLFHEMVPDHWIDKIFAVMALASEHTFQILTKRPERMRAYFEERVPDSEPDRFDPWPRSSIIELAALQVVGDGNYAHGTVAKRWPLPNVWLGVSVEDQRSADERVPLLLDTPAAVRFVSYEPALGPVDFGYRGCGALLVDGGGQRMEPQAIAPLQVDWVIVGGESGPGARPFDVAWARSTLSACRAAGVACFVKQLGARVRESGEHLLLEDLGWPAAVAYDARHEFLRLHHRKGGDPAEWPEDLRVREFPAVATGATA